MPSDAVPAEKRHLILSIARPEAYVPLARSILGRMGYAILTPEEWSASPSLAEHAPELAIVDERRLGELDDAARLAATPLIVLCGASGRAAAADRRVVGVIPRPAGLHELFRLFQQSLETIVRGGLRVPTNLPARMRRGAREWHGSLLSLSENGCLVRSPEPLSLGAHLELTFELPRVGPITTRAETTYQLITDTGLVFESTPAALRRAISSFVEEQLAA